MTSISMHSMRASTGLRSSAAAATRKASPLPCPIGAPRTINHHHRSSSSSSIIAWARFVLTPTGDGSLSHLDAAEAEALSANFSSRAPIPLQQGLYEVGREQPAELVLAVPTVSARHARLSVGDAAVTVADLGSTNGTYLDGNPLEPMAEVAVGVGQEVVFGDQYLAKYRLDREEE